LLAKAGHCMLDAPVSGGPDGAEAGSLLMMVGGEAAHLERARTVLDALASKIVHIGARGTGHAAKLVNNLLCAAPLITAAEAVALGKAAGIEPERLLNAINEGSGRSAVTEVNYPRWVLNETFNSGFTMKLMRKDVRQALSLIENTRLRLPLAAQIGRIWQSS